MGHCYLLTCRSCSLRRDVTTCKRVFHSLVESVDRWFARRSAALNAPTVYRDADVTMPAFTH